MAQHGRRAFGEEEEVGRTNDAGSPISQTDRPTMNLVSFSLPAIESSSSPSISQPSRRRLGAYSNKWWQRGRNGEPEF